MKKYPVIPVILLGFVIVFSWSACQEAKNNPATNEEITIEIDGMMCENACGAKIKKELLEIQGVDAVIVDFVGINKKNSVKVIFHPDQCSLGVMKKKIERIGGGSLYHVKSMSN